MSIEYSDKTKIRDDLSEALKKMVSRSLINMSLYDRVEYFSEDLEVVWKVLWHLVRNKMLQYPMRLFLKVFSDKEVNICITIQGQDSTACSV